MKDSSVPRRHGSSLAEVELSPLPDLSVDQQRENCAHILEAAGNIATALRINIEQQVVASNPVFAQEASSAFESIEESAPVNKYYLEEPGTWLQEVVWAIAQGRKTIVSLPWFCMVTNKDEDGIDRVVDNFSPYEYSTCSIGGLMRAIRPPHNEMQINYPIYDDADPATGKLFNESARLRFQAGVDQFLRSKGTIWSGDRQGRDYNLLSLARGRQLFTTKLLPHLEDSQWGTIRRLPKGAVAFHPDDGLLDIIPKQIDAKRREQYSRDGIYVAYSDGSFSSAALTAAATAWQPQNKAATRLTISHTKEDAANEQFMLFRALGLTQLERFHTLRMPPKNREPFQDLSQYALYRRIEEYTSRFMESFDYDDFNEFDPVEYAMRNYGESMLTDDKNLCMLTMFALDFLGIKDARAADVGCGPNLYPAMLLEPYSRTIDLLEFAASNRAFLEQWFTRKLPPDQQHIFNKFAMLMLGGGGSKYHNVIPRLEKGYEDGRVKVTFGDSFNLPEGEWDLLTSSFVGDSIIWQKLLFPSTVREMRRALRHEGVNFSAYVLNDPNHKGYPAGKGRKFPNISQSTEEIRRVYIDSGFECIVLPTAGPEKFRDGYFGLAFVVAAHRGSHMASKIRELTRPLHEFAAAGFGIAV